MAWSTEIASDGRVSASAELQLIVPAVPSIQFSRVRYRRNGTVTYSDALVVMGTGTRLVKISGLVPGLFYDFEAATVSGPNESTVSTITNQLAPGDTTVPSPPGTPSIQGIHLREVTLGTATGSELDLKDIEFDVRTASGGGGFFVISGSAPAVKGGTTTKTLTIPANFPYGTTLFARARAKDYTGNPTSPTAGWSSATSFTIAQAATVDYAPLSVTSAILANLAVIEAKLAALAVTTAKRQDPTVQTFAYSVGGGVGTTTTVTIFHSLGRIPAPCEVFPANSGVTASLDLVTSASVRVTIVNLTVGVQSGTATLHMW